jgi:hypothetical protein
LEIAEPLVQSFGAAAFELPDGCDADPSQVLCDRLADAGDLFELVLRRHTAGSF